MRLRTYVLAVAALAMGGAASAQAVGEEAIVQRSLVSMGDTARLRGVFARARRGEPITVAVIGGSITQGAAATTPEHRYGNLVAAWWQRTFPKARITFVNAGIGATGSNYGALRAQRDLLVHKPDFVVAEYAVNDGNAQPFAETLEGLVRQVLKQRQKPAMMLLFMMNRGGGTAQEWHSKVGAHYGLPMVSYHDALWPEIEAGRLKWTDISPDEVHPNDRGHELATRFVTNLLERALAMAPEGARAPRVAAVPKPLFTDLWEHVRLYEAMETQPVANAGWTLDTQGKLWHSDTPGSVIEFEVEGRLVTVNTFRIRGAMGRARVQVDDSPPVTVEGWFDATWGGYQPTEVVGRDLKPGKHRVRIELLPDKAPESGGHEFKLFSIGTAGVDR